MDPKDPSKNYHAIVDMGSNGIRLAIVDLSPPLARLLPCIYSSRIPISLYDVQYDSNNQQVPIPAETIQSVVRSLKAFKRTCADFTVPSTNVRILATEATRKALNLQKFIKRIKEEVGWEVELLAKEREGIVGAYGIASSYWSVEGVTMDLGGGSTQVSWVRSKDGEINIPSAGGGSVSLPYGAAELSKRLADAGEVGGARWKELANEVMDGLEDAFRKINVPEDLPKGKRLNLYLSGGGFRGYGFALLSQHTTSPYPIPIINGFHAQIDVFRASNNVVERLASVGSQADDAPRIFRISARRADQVPAVAFLISCLLDVLPPVTDVYFCQGGVREGVLYQHLDPSVRAQHPLVAITSPHAPKGSALLECLTWVQREHIFNEHVLMAFVNSMYVHAAYPKDTAASAALRSTTTGLFANAFGANHFERAVLALLLCERHGGHESLSPSDQDFYMRMQSLVDSASRQHEHQPGDLLWWCRLVGRLAAVLAAVYPAGVVNEERVQITGRWSYDDAEDGHLTRGGGSKKVLHLRFFFIQIGTDEALLKACKAVEKTGKKKNRPNGVGYKVLVTTMG